MSVHVNWHEPGWFLPAVLENSTRGVSLSQFLLTRAEENSVAINGASFKQDLDRLVSSHFVPIELINERKCTEILICCFGNLFQGKHGITGIVILAQTRTSVVKSLFNVWVASASYLFQQVFWRFDYDDGRHSGEEWSTVCGGATPLALISGLAERPTGVRHHHSNS